MDRSEPEQTGKKGENCEVTEVGSVKSDESMDVLDHEEVTQSKSSQAETGESQVSSSENQDRVTEFPNKCDINPSSSEVVMTAEVGSPISEVDEVMEVSDGKDRTSLDQGDVGGPVQVPDHSGHSKDPPSSDSDKDFQAPECKKEPVYYPCLLPQINCPEKIVICVDMSSEMNQLPFKFGNGSKFPPISMVKRVTEIFVQNKTRINKKHEYALVALHEKATWVKGFSSDPNDVCYALDNFTNTRLCNNCELSSLFKLIPEKIEFPEGPDPLNPLPFIVRVILIYGRSNCIPRFNDEIVSLKALKKTGCFFFDVLYIHEPASPDNKCQEVFESFCDMDENMTSYLFEVTRNTTKLHNCMAKLLSHPLQRPVQKNSSYKL